MRNLSVSLFECLSVCSTSVRRSLALLVPSLFFAFPTFAAQPDYLHAALEKFMPEPPKNWAYTLTIERDGSQTTERFDPSKPPAGQWSLLRIDGHAPDPGDLEKYFKYKASQAPGVMPAAFNKGDIEPGTVKLVHEDDDRAEFTCGFREQSTHGDKMLGHLGLLLTIDKHRHYVEKFTMRLGAPYSPVLTVKMNELVITMNFAPPNDRQPSFPAQSS